VKYRDGVMLMADTQGSYGGLAMFKALQRITAVNSQTICGASGEFSDFQYIQRLLTQLTTQDFAAADGSQLTAKEIHAYLSRIMYARRSKVNPLWNSIITAGVDAKTNEAFLGIVDLYGSNYTGDLFATGYGQHLAIPLLRKRQNNNMSAEEAKQLLEECMEVLLYRDCRALNKFHLATITKDGPQISEPYSIKTKWDFKLFVNPGSAGEINATTVSN
jgi:20S proteasome subunit beta 7